MAKVKWCIANMAAMKDHKMRHIGQDDLWAKWCHRNQHRAMCGRVKPCPHWDGREKSIYQEERDGKN